MQAISSLALGDRIAAWANYFWGRGDARYHFGLEDGGYANAGRLVDDFATDCVLFFYRTTELGRSSNALEAVRMINRPAELLFGCSGGEALGRPCWEVARLHYRNGVPFCGPDCPVRRRARESGGRIESIEEGVVVGQGLPVRRHVAGTDRHVDDVGDRPRHVDGLELRDQFDGGLGSDPFNAGNIV